MTDVVSSKVLEGAYQWLCKRRRDYPARADVWSFRQRWEQEKERLKAELLEGRYRLGLLSRITLANGEQIDLWSARDALVLKCLSRILAQRLPLSRHCTHLKGHGGAKGAVRQVLGQLGQHRFLMRTDVRSYYASIDHQLLLDRLERFIPDRRVLNLIGQYLGRCSERGGCFWEFRQGISLGCPLSPIMGAFYLAELDEALERLGLVYVRFMDDILVLAPSRWKLRRAVRVLTQVLASLKLEKHPEKTFIGRVQKGFDFLGYHFSPAGLSLAQQTLERFVERAIRLYEQEPGEPFDSSRLGAYVRRWLGWAGGGMSGLVVLADATTFAGLPTRAHPDHPVVG